MTLHPVTVGPARFRIGDWHGQNRVAHMVPLTTAITLRDDVLDQVLSRLNRHGYRSVITAALGTSERDVLIAAGFDVREELSLLRHGLGSRLPERHWCQRLPTRRGRNRDMVELLRLDSEVFTPFWHLDLDGFREALAATRLSRLRISGRTEMTAYSMTGWTGPQGYLQRLAVDPAHQGRGIGTMLVAEALYWLRRKRAQSAFVNTQLHNDGALALYQKCGFELQRERLAVLGMDL